MARRLHTLSVPPDVLEEVLCQVQLIALMLDPLSFLDEACSDRLIACIHKPLNLLFWSMNTTFFYNFYDSNKGLVTDKRHIKNLKANNTPEFHYQKYSPFFANSINDSPDESPLVFYYHTFKCCPIDGFDARQLLNEQISWTIPNRIRLGNKASPIMSKIAAYLSKYEDFAGLYCTYSGNKSVHIHTEWHISDLDIRFTSNPLGRHAKEILDNFKIPANEIMDKWLRPGLMHCWDVIADEISQIIKQHRGVDVKFDEALRAPDSYRRLSWGTRMVDNDNEFFARGVAVRQIELWGYCREIWDLPENKFPKLHEMQVFLNMLRSH